MTFEELSIERDVLNVLLYQVFTHTHTHTHSSTIRVTIQFWIAFIYIELFARLDDSLKWDNFRQILLLVILKWTSKSNSNFCLFVWFSFCISNQWCGWTWANCCLRSDLYWNIQSWWSGLSKWCGPILSGITNNRSSISY